MQQWPQYLASLLQVPGLKDNPALFKKLTEKFNEINIKNKIKDTAQVFDTKPNFPFNNIVNNNIINFDLQIEEKRTNKDLSQVSKMPIFQSDEFNKNFKTLSVNEKQGQATPQFMLQSGAFLPSPNYFQQQGNKTIIPNMPKSKFFI